MEKSDESPGSSEQEMEEEQKKPAKDQASKPRPSAYLSTQFDMEGVKAGSFKVHRRTLRLLFSNVEKQIDVSNLPPEFLTAKGFLTICIRDMLGGFSNIDYAANAKHTHEDKTTHFHQKDKLLKKLKTTDPSTFKAGGVQGHVLATDSKHGWGLEGVFRYMWFVVSHLNGVMEIVKYLNDPVHFYFVFGKGRSIAGIKDTDVLYERFISFWMAEKQREIARKTLRRQSTLSISDSSTHYDKNKINTKNKDDSDNPAK